MPQNTVHSGRGMVIWNLLDVLPGFLVNKSVFGVRFSSAARPDRDFHIDLDKVYAQCRTTMT
jgi:hypothetical protein